MSSSGPASRPLGHHRLTLENVPIRTGSPATWGDSVRDWTDYLSDKRDKRLFFEGATEENAGEAFAAPYSHRFRKEYTEMQYAKIQGFSRGALDEYDDPHIAFLTLSTSTLEPNGEPRPPIDHLEELLGTWGDGVYYELNRVMEADRKGDPWEPRPDWEYLLILEPTTDEGHVPGGYAHVHAAIVVDGAVEPERFEGVIGRHLTEAPNARGDAHEFDDAIEVKSADELRNPGAYLFKYLGKSWDVEDMADYEKRFAALLLSTGRQRLRASNGAQRWMKRDVDDSEEGNWRFAGVGEVHHAEQLAEFDGGDLEDFLYEHGARTLREWITGVPSIETTAAAKGETYSPAPLPGDWSFAGLSSDDVGRYVRELVDEPRPPPGPRGSTDRPPPEPKQL